MDKKNESLPFPDYHPNPNGPWKRFKDSFKTKKTETMEEAVGAIKSYLGWILVLLVMILMSLSDLSDKLGD